MYYALNADTTINPLLGNEYAGTMTDTMLVLRKRNFGYGKPGGKPAKPIVLSGSGFGYDLAIGVNIDLTSDQSRRFMGTYQVIGVVEGHTVRGEVPSRKFKHYVMK